MLKRNREKEPGRFKVPYINGKYLVPVVIVATVLVVYFYDNQDWSGFFKLKSDGNWLPFSVLADKIPMLIFIVALIVIVILTYIKNLSSIPVLGLLSCLFLMTELGYTNWLRFVIWLVIGLIIYFTFSRKHSKLEEGNEKQ